MKESGENKENDQQKKEKIGNDMVGVREEKDIPGGRHRPLC